MKIKKILFMMLITVVATLGITSVNALTISDDGKYTLLLGSDEYEPTIDGEYIKVIRFNATEGETTVKLSELTKGIVPFNGKNEFSYWETDSQKRASEELNLADFTKKDYYYGKDGEKIDYTNGLTLSAKFDGKSLKETDKFYLNIDAFGGTVNGKAVLSIESTKSGFNSIDLTKYTPVREGYTFKGWDLGGKIVTSIDSSAFAKDNIVNVIATYTKNTFDGKKTVLILNANGGKIDDKESNKYDYVAGRFSGTSMSLLPYIPVREGYTFNGWNTKKDGSGKNYKYIYWRIWDKNDETDREFEKDTLTTEESGYEWYKNVTLYASWTKNKEIKNDGEVKASIIFDKEINKEYVLDIKKVEVKKELADKNVKYVVDINVLENKQIVKINDTKMKIKIALPEDLKGYKKYEVVYIKDNQIQETIPATIEDGYIVFETSHLSEYGIVATEKSSGTNVENPKTGDNVMLYLATGILSIIGLAGASLIVYRKKQTN